MKKDYKKIISVYKTSKNHLQKRLLQIDKIHREVWGLIDRVNDIDSIWCYRKFIYFHDRRGNISKFNVEYLEMDDNDIKQKETKLKEESEKKAKRMKIEDLKFFIKEYEKELKELVGVK